MTNKEIIISNLNKIHTTDLGIIRIKKNVENLDIDVVTWCKEKILKSNNITKNGKNYYIKIDNIVITLNSFSYTLITVHKIK